MNTRTLIILTLILGLSAAGLLYRKAVRTQADQARAVTLHRFANADVDAAAVTSVELASPDKATVRLDKGAGGWVVTSLDGVPANAASVEHLVTLLATLDGELRSTDAASLTEYGLDDGQALRLTLRQGDRDTLRLLLGKADLRQAFVRRDGSTEVYVVPGSVSGQAGIRNGTPGAQFWIETKLLAVDPDDVRELRVSVPGGESVLTRVEPAVPANATRSDNATTAAPQWAFTPAPKGGKGLTRDQLDTVRTSLRRVSAAEALPATDPRVPALAKAPYALSVRTADRVITLRAIRAGQDVVARVDGSAHAYTMHETVFATLFPDAK